MIRENYSNIGVERYLSPPSGRMTTMFLPLFSGLDATTVAAWSAAPDEIPIRMPSVLTVSLAAA